MTGIAGRRNHEPLAGWLTRIEGDVALTEPMRWRERDEVLDQLDAWRSLAGVPDDPALPRRIDALEARLLAIDHALHETVRAAIRHGAGREVLLGLVRTGPALGEHAAPSSDRYDVLDALVAGVLGLAPDEPAWQPLGPDMVFYQPTPARHMLNALEQLRLGPDDVLMDLGAGLGHVPLVAAICTPARCIGIEWQAACVMAARACAADLGLDRVAFIQGDLCEADLGEGTVFYLYTPVSGALLRRVLDRLRSEAERRAIRLCTLGPCTEVVAGETWLRADRPCDRHRPVVFRSR
ncbi:MAG TPA: hypothetical protein VFR91_01605 [Dyella sp.]|nr:hypothetical protein [Dyella sp.]